MQAGDTQEQQFDVAAWCGREMHGAQRKAARGAQRGPGGPQASATAALGANQYICLMQVVWQ